MAKEKGNVTFQSKEAFQRMNFLYQSCRTMMTQCPDKPDIAAYYANLVTNISKKSVLRIEPKVKRTICKGCCSLLIPGVSARIRLRKKSSQRLIWTCLRCKTMKKFNTSKSDTIWSEKPEALVNTIVLENAAPSSTDSKDK